MWKIYLKYLDFIGPEPRYYWPWTKNCTKSSIMEYLDSMGFLYLNRRFSRQKFPWQRTPNLEEKRLTYFAWIDMNRRSVNLSLKVIRINMKWFVGTSHDHQQDLSSSLWLVREIEQNIDETCVVIFYRWANMLLGIDETCFCAGIFFGQKKKIPRDIQLLSFSWQL